MCVCVYVCVCVCVLISRQPEWLVADEDRVSHVFHTLYDEKKYTYSLIYQKWHQYVTSEGMDRNQTYPIK